MPSPPSLRRKAGLGLGQVALIVAVVALALGASALGISVANYRPSPAASPGIVIAHATLGSGAVPIPRLGHCENISGLILKINVSGPGTVVVTASILVTLYHSSAYYAAAGIYVSNASTSCPGAEVLAYIDNGVASGTYFDDVSAVGSFTVSAAGTASYYVTGYDYSTGTDYTQGGYMVMVGVFYPST